MIYKWLVSVDVTFLNIVKGLHRNNSQCYKSNIKHTIVIPTLSMSAYVQRN